MQNRRAVLVIVAVVLAVAAFGLAFIVLNNAQDEAKSDLKTVYIATRPIARGTTLDSGSVGTYFKQSKVEVAPADAVRDPKSLAGKTALIDIRTDQQVTTQLFGEKAQAARLSSSGNDVAGELDPGTEAITFAVDEVKGVGGYVAPGDTINVIVYDASGVTLFTIDNVLVLRTAAAPTVATTTTAATSGTAAASASTGTFTIRVSRADALRLVDGTTKQIYVSLNPPAPTTTTAAAPAPANK